MNKETKWIGVSNGYKDFMRRKSISYIIAGEDSLDLEEVILKIHKYFQIDNITPIGI